MSKGFYDKLINILKENEKFIDSNDELVKNEIIDSTLKGDKDLIELLVNNEQTKEVFFHNIDEYLVFDSNKFIEYIDKKNFFHNSYTKFANKIGLNIDNKSLTERGEVSLVWPFKDCVLEGGMTKEDKHRKEIFFNETLAQDEIDRLFEPKVLSNFKKFSNKNETSEFNFLRENLLKDNLIINGNNLLALHSLKTQFKNKIKLIYIDPPFNTENDSFKYNDSFNHSTWLTFMKNRLKAAKQLLRDDGLIFVHLDNIEAPYLKVLMDELFFRENFVNIISVQSSSMSGTKTSHRERTILKSQDFILVYALNKEKILFKPQYTKKDEWDNHYSFYMEKVNNGFELLNLTDKLKKEKLLMDSDGLNDFNIKNKKHQEFLEKNMEFIVRKSTHSNNEIKDKCSNEYKDRIYSENGNFYFKHNQLQPVSRKFNEILDGQTLKIGYSNLLGDMWTDIDFQNTQNQGNISFPKGKKPEQLLYRIIDMTTKEGDIILDFFLGSGTTAAVAHKMKRQYIGIEQIDYQNNSAVNRLQNVIGKFQDNQNIDYDNKGMSEALNWKGGGSFVYCELMKYNEEAVEIINKSENIDELLKIWDLMCEKYFLNYDVDIKKFNDNIDDFKTLDLEEQKKFLVKFLNKNQLYVNLSEIDDSTFNINDETKRLNKQFYNI